MPFSLRLAAVLAAAVLTGTLCASSAENVSPVRTVLFPARHAVLSSRVDSVVLKHHFREGEAFRQGDVLTDFDPLHAELQRIRAAATVEETRASLGFARQNLVIAEDLFKKGMQGKQEVERVTLEVQVAEARLKSAEAVLVQAGRDLEDCKLTAPYGGRVIRRLTQEFESVRSTQQVIQIIDDRTLLAVFHLPSDLHSKTRIGEARRIRIDETGQTRTGKIVQVSGEIDSASRTFEVRIELDNADSALAAGMSGVVEP